MLNKDLIEKLKEYPEDLEIEFEADVLFHTCFPDSYCYCIADPKRFYLIDTLLTSEKKHYLVTGRLPETQKVDKIIIKGEGL